MRLVVSCPTPHPSLTPLLRRRPFLLLPVLGKPLIAYHLDLASSLGVEAVTILADDRPERVRKLVLDGQAWGLRVEVVAIPAGLEVERQLSRLPHVRESLLVLAADALVPPLVSERDRREVPVDSWGDEAGFVLARPPVSAGQSVGSGPFVAPPSGATRIGDIRHYHRVQLELLADPGGFVRPGWEAAPGIVISRGCRFSLGAVVQPPVLIGEYARVSYRANLGPGVAVGPHCLVDDEASLVESVVLPRTYVGRLLAGDGLILDGQLIVNARTGACAAVDDELLLADLERSWFAERLRRLVGRVAGALLVVPALPWLGLAWLVAKPPRVFCVEVHSQRSRLAVDGTPVRLTTTVHEINTPRLLLRRLAWLWDLAAGRLAWFGNPPLSLTRAEGLDPVLRERWLDVPAGVFGLAQVEALRAGVPLDPEAEAAAAVLNASRSGARYRLGLVLRSAAAWFSPRAWGATQA